MASDKSRLGKNIVAALQASGDYPSDAKPDQIQKTIAQWTVIAGAILDELTGHMDIDLSSGDIKVLPGSFMDGSHAPVTGLGLIQATDLTGKLK